MPEESIPAPETTEPKPTAQARPLSAIAYGSFTVLTFEREVSIPVADGKLEVTREIMVNIRREARNQYDDPGSIPLTDLPALQMMLREIAGSAMVVTPFPQKQPSAKKVKTKKRK